MENEELADNLFRIVQTEAKLKKEQIAKEQEANLTHYEVGKVVRETIERLGETMPEDLPTPKKTISEIEHEELYKLIQKSKKISHVNNS